MSQDIFTDINPGSTSGTQLATLLNLFKNAFASGLTGESRPAELQAGGSWIDTSQEDSPNFLWTFKTYTGTTDIEIFTINLSTNKVSFPGSSEDFEIFRYSEDAVGPVLTLTKRRVASNGQVADEDVIGEAAFVGRTNTSTNPIVAKFKAVATEAMTATQSGAAFVWEQMLTGAASLAERMRLVDGKLGIGTAEPEAELHTSGNNGIMAERESDDANAAALIVQKSRIAGTGAVQNNDVLGGVDIKAQDSSGVKSVVARIRASATEGHTSSNKGAKWLIQVIKSATNSLVDKITIGDDIAVKGALSVEALTLEVQDVASSATITQLSAAKAAVRITGSTATVIEGIDSAGISKTLLIHNDMASASVTLSNADADAAEADRFNLPSNRNIVISPQSSVEVFYDASDSRWKVKSGSGSGGGSRTVKTTISSVGAAGNLRSSLDDYAMEQTIRVQSTGGEVSAAGVLFSTTDMSLISNGARVTLVGASNDDYIKIPYANSTWGVVGPFEEISLTLFKSVTFEKNDEEQRWIFVGGSNA